MAIDPTVNSYQSKPVNIQGVATDLPVYTPVDPSAGGGVGGALNLSSTEMFDNIQTKPMGAANVPANSIYLGDRYKQSFPGRDTEEMYAQQQGQLTKWSNGFGKMTGLATTSFLSGTVGVVTGIGAMIADQRFASLYDNPVNRGLDDFNKKMEDYLPNYYTRAETDASWYSPKNTLTANFWSDKVLKNLGYSIGSMAGGFAWGAVLKGIGLTNALVKAGKGFETIEAVESAIATAPKAAQFGEITKALTSLSTKYVKPAMGTVLTNANRGITSVMGTMGEASMEALGNMNEYRTKLISEYKNQYGVDPTGAALEEINTYADKVGNFTWGMNVALLSATNYIQLPKILASSKTAEKRLMNETIKTEVEAGATIAEKVGANYIVKPSMLERVAGAPGKFANRFIIQPAKLLFAPIEAFEEGAQFSIQKGTDDFFDRAYDTNADITSFWDNLTDSIGNVLTKGVKETLTTKEGMENILIGGISGGIQTSFSPFGDNTIKERGLFGEGGTRGKNTTLAITELNKSKKLTQVLKDGVKYLNIAVNSQAKRQEAILNNDTLSEKDYEQDFTLAYIMPRVKYGKIDSIKEELELYRAQASTPQGFQELQSEGIVLANETKEKFIERINKIQETAILVNQNYEMINDKYSGLVNDKNERLYDDSVIEKLAYAFAKIIDYDGRIPQLNSKLSLHGINTSDILQSVTKDEKINKELVAKVALEINSLDTNSDIKEELTTALYDMTELALRRKSFITEYDTIKNNPEKHKAQTIADLPKTQDGKPTDGKPIVIKTKRGEKTYTTGVEYMLGKVVEYSKLGHEVYRAPKLTILGEKEGDVITVKTSTGKIIDISKKELESYSLTPVSTVTSDKKANFFYEHWNTIFTHYGIKDKNGKPVVGRLEYTHVKGKLVFVYKDDSGVIRRKEVWGSLFKAKPGFEHGVLAENGTLTAVQQAAKKEFVEAKITMSDKLQTRANIITTLYENTTARIEEINNKLEKNKEQLASITQKIEDTTTKTKAGTPRKKVTTIIKQTVTQLSNLYKTIETENYDLEKEKEELEMNVPFFKEFLDDLQALPESGREMIAQLKSEIAAMEELIDVDNEALKNNVNLLKEITIALDEALSIFNDYIKRLREENPNIPLSLELLEANLEKYLGEEGTKQFIAERLGFTEQVMQLESDILDFTEELKIPELKDNLVKLAEANTKIEAELTNLINKQMAKVEILEAFNVFVEKQKQLKEEEANLEKNEALKQQFIGTNDTSVQNFFEDIHYEFAAKKDWDSVVGGTIPINDGKPHQARANYFGVKFHGFENKSAIRGITVTSKTEDEVLPGLTEHLLSQLSDEDRAKYKANEIIVLVMVEDNEDGSPPSLIDQDGKPIAKTDEKGTPINALDHAIFQVFPLEELTAKYKDEHGNWKTETMFRDDVPADIKTELRTKYKAWRDDVLTQTVVGTPQKIKVSFGFPEYITQTIEENGKTKTVRDYEARSTAKETGLIDDSTLVTDQVVKIATTNESVSNGSVTFNTPLGRVFLKVPGGLVKLFNRKLTKNEVSTIFDVILQISKNAVEDGKVTDRSNKLFNWLRSTIYWGIAKTPEGKRKPAGYNNVWFEEVEEEGKKVTRLFISGKTTDTTTAFEFTPTALLSKKEAIISLLGELYHNSSATLVNDKAWKKSYYEITGIDKNGEPIVKEWANYQTYLLSDKEFDSDGKVIGTRDKANIPLTTQIRPVKNEDDINRNGVYFTLNTTIEDYLPQGMPTAKRAAKVLAPAVTATATTPVVVATPVVAPVQTVAPIAKPIPIYNLEGEENTIQLGTFGSTTFKINGLEYIASDGAKGFTPTFDAELMNALMIAKGYTEEQARNIIAASIVAKLQGQLAALTIPIDTEQVSPITTTPEPTILKEPVVITSTSDIEVRKAAIIDEWASESMNNTREWEERALSAAEDGLDINTPESQDEADEWKMFGTPQEQSTNAIDNKYKKLLSDLENTHIEETTYEVVPSTEDAPRISSFKTRPRSNRPDNTDLRAKLVKEVKRFKGENWKNLEAWLKVNFPNVPVYRVKNIIQATNGKQAWGMLQDGAIYIYENAEVGTAYHEVFEAVWKMFADPNEKKEIISEFRNREGSYSDRFTGEKVEYKTATDAQIKEELAEEFRDFVLFKKSPTRGNKGKSWIARLFNDLVNFIKEFFTGKDAMNNTQKLFNKIGNGYYNSYNPYVNKLAYAKVGIINIEDAHAGLNADFRLNNIPAVQLHDIVQHMTFRTLKSFSDTNKSLFGIGSLSKQGKTELYTKLKGEILDLVGNQLDMLEEAVANKEITEEEVANKYNALGLLYDNIVYEWEDIVKKHQQQLKTYAIEFDENDNLTLTDEDKSGKSDWQDARKIDSFRKANSAIKILLATIAETTIENGKPTWKPSTIGGVKLMAADQVFISLMDRLHDSINIDDMFAKLRVLANGNPNYAALYQRLTKNAPSQPVDFSELEDHDLLLVSAFWKIMKKQNADVATVFILASGEVVVSDTTLNKSSKQFKREILNNIVAKIKGENSYFKYDSKKGTYTASDKIKKIKLDASRLEQYIAFLKELNVEFKLKDIQNKLNDKQRELFRTAVEGILESFSKVEDLVTLTNKTLNVDKRLMQLGIIKAVIENPGFESTYFNINNERTQTYVGVNAVSNLHDVLSKLKNINDLNDEEKGYSAFKFLLTDKFAKGSLLLKKMFDLGPQGTGKRVTDTENILQPVFVDGMINEKNGKKKESSKQTYKQRLIQEINLNLSGIYLTLVPGDASIEHAVKLHTAEDPFITEEAIDNKKYISIFRDYFISEVELSRDDRNVKNKTDLRFFKAILADNTKSTAKDINKLHDSIVSAKNKNLSPEALYKAYEKEINSAITNFIESETEDMGDMLSAFGIISITDEGLVIEDIEFADVIELTEEVLDSKLRMLSVNYIIANIELHKLVFSDPYQYMDELKRIKNFTSPRQPLMHSSSLINSAFNKIFNKGFSSTDIGYTDMTRDYFRTITIDDVWSTNELTGYQKPYEETDGGGIITLKAYRNFRLRAGDWTSDHEKQYRHDINYEKLVKSGATEEEVKKFEKQNPGIKSTYTPIKPIVSGSKDNGRDYNDIVLHKFALVPFSFRILHTLNPTSNAIKLYNKMQAEDVDYAVYSSGSKVGTEEKFDLYTQEGQFNTALFQTSTQTNNKDLPQGVSNIPFSIMSVQSEVPSKDTPAVTQGSQITKLVTMDFLEAGMPIDFEIKDKKGNVITDFEQRFVEWIKLDTEDKKSTNSPLYKLIKYNQQILEAKIQNSYDTLLTKLAIEKTEEGYVITDKVKLIEELRNEILKRDVNDNIIDAFEGFEKGDVVLEATPVYQQIRNILYSIADHNVISPKISGGMKVQIPSTLFESDKIEGTTFVNKQGETKVAYSSDVLKFYKNVKGERVCEIMVGRWFDSDKSDEELIEELNESGILNGVAYRIPTQKQNSIDVFKIAKFLPKEFGDSVVIPSALVKKVGSDFDIDKLSIYFKNIFKDAEGNIKLIPFFGYGQQAKDKFKQMYNSIVQKEIQLSEAKLVKQDQLSSLFGDIALGVSSNKLVKKWIPLFKEWFADELIDDKLPVDVIEEIFIARIEKLNKRLAKLTDRDIQEVMADITAEQWYKKSLENEYIQSLEDLVSHELNFDNLIKPNSADQLKDLTSKINKKRGKITKDYSSVGNMLSRSFMTNLRHSFVTGKYAIGIAAVAQTAHAQFQRFAGYIDLDKLNTKQISDVDNTILGGNALAVTFANNPNINFQEYNSIVVDGKKRPTLSMRKNKAGDFISDIIGQFIDGYVDISKGPWIMELGASPNVAGTWLFLIKLGVPIDTVAYFINQPIVRSYLRSVENKGYSWLYIENLIQNSLENYSPDEEYITSGASVSGIPNETDLFKTVGKSAMDMSNVEKAQQQYILKEFLKYAKMAEHLFLVTQGSNFDTATINDPFLIFKKKLQLKKAQSTVISSVDDVLKNSFIGVLKDVMFDIRDAFSTILLSDRPSDDSSKYSVRDVLEEVLLPHINLNDRAFVKLAQKAVTDLFDWAMQTNTGINKSVATTLLGTDTVNSAASAIIDYRDSILGNEAKGISAKRDHPLYDNIILNSIKIESGIKNGKPNNLYIAGRDNKVYDQNLIIAGFNELRKGLADENNSNLYSRIIALTVLQSGLSNSPIAFTNLLPYADFKKVYNETLSNLENIPNLAKFSELHVFERNNWNNDDIVTYKRATMILMPDFQGFQTLRNVDLILDKKLKKAIDNKRLPKIVGINKFEGRSDFMVYTWEDKISKAAKIKAKKTGDRSHINKALMQKVYMINEEGERVPVIQITQSKSRKSGEMITYEKYLYKAINAWGDSFRAQEFYTEEIPSVIDNDFLKVEKTTDAEGNILSSGEVSDDVIVKILGYQQVTKDSGQPSITPIEIKNFSIGNTVIDNDYNVWQIISIDEWRKETPIPSMTAGVKARFITNVNPIESKRQQILNQDATTHIKPNSVNTLPEGMPVSTYSKNTKNAPEGLPAINRTPKTCG